MLRVLFGFVFLWGMTGHSNAQFWEPYDTLNKRRLTGLLVAEGTLYASSMVMLDRVWYQYYDRTSFHAFNDNTEWLQLDKVGHMFTSYKLGGFGYHSLRWAGVSKKKALWYGGGLGSFYLLSMEVFDGFAQEWGFSWGDIGSNVLGSALFIAQESVWEEQRVTMKFSARLTPMAGYRPRVLGSSFGERILKDYNGQTYWLSASPASFIKGSSWPAWLNVAVGYGGEEMVSGRPEDAGLYAGVFNRYREYYLSLDLDFSRIPTSKPWLKVVFKGLNMLKLPFPTIGFTKNGVEFYPLFF